MTIITQFSANGIANDIGNLIGLGSVLTILLVFTAVICLGEICTSTVNIARILEVIFVIVCFVMAVILTCSIDDDVYTFSVIKIEDDDKILDLVNYENVIPLGDDVFIVRPAIDNPLKND